MATRGAWTSLVMKFIKISLLFSNSKCKIETFLWLNGIIHEVMMTQTLWVSSWKITFWGHVTKNLTPPPDSLSTKYSIKKLELISWELSETHSPTEFTLIINDESYFRVNEIAGDLAKCMHEKSQDKKFYEASIKEIVQYE